jgi:hypothetical protein
VHINIKVAIGFLCFDIAFSFLDFYCEFVFFLFIEVVNVFCFAVATNVGVCCEYSVFPGFYGFIVAVSTVRALTHNISAELCICLCLKDFPNFAGVYRDCFKKKGRDF